MSDNRIASAIQKKYTSNITGEEAEEELYLEEEERYTPMSQRWGDTSTNSGKKQKHWKSQTHRPSSSAKSVDVLVSSVNDDAVEEEQHRLHDAILQDYSIYDLEQSTTTDYHHTIMDGERKWRNKKQIRTILIIATGIIVLLFCTEGVTFLVQKATNSNNHKNPTDEIPQSTTSYNNNNNETLSSSIHYYQVPLPPSDLDVTCSISNVETPEGYTACQLSCDPASCCLSNLQNCRWNNQPICDMYNSCMLLSAYTGTESNIILPLQPNNMMSSTNTTTNTITNATTSNSILPDAPSNIESLCSPSNRETRNGSIQCDEICRYAACCKSSCSTSPQCINYQICFTTHILDYIPIHASNNQNHSSTTDGNNNTVVKEEEEEEELDISVLCDDISNPKCIQKCQDRQCCFTSYNNCYTEYNTWCDDYAICKDLPLWEAVEQQFHTTTYNDTTNIHPTSEFQQKCSMYLSAFDLDDCQKLCQERSCCFTVDGCGTHTDTLCHESFECINLPNFEEFYNKAHGTQPIIYSSSSTPATTITIIGTEEQSTISTTTISTAGITVTGTTTNTTSSSTEQVDTSVKAAVYNVCSSSAIAINGTQDCEDVCKERSCCFIIADISKPSSCSDNPALKGWCEEYSACQILLRPQTATGTSGNNNNTSTYSSLTIEDTQQNTTTTTTNAESAAALSSAVQDVAAATTADTLNSACASDYVQLHGKHACQELCADRACCFTEGPLSCTEELHDWCLQFSACNILVNDHEQPKTTTTTTNTTNSNAAVTKACSPASLQDSKAECQELCDDRACCFAAGSFNCSEELRDWCHEYSACNALIELEEEQQASNATGINIFQVDEICDSSKMQDSTYASQCTNLCSTRSCCFEYKGSDYNCYELNLQWCDEFKSCWNLPKYRAVTPTPISFEGG